MTIMLYQLVMEIVRNSKNVNYGTSERLKWPVNCGSHALQRLRLTQRPKSGLLLCNLARKGYQKGFPEVKNNVPNNH